MVDPSEAYDPPVYQDPVSWSVRLLATQRRGGFQTVAAYVWETRGGGPRVLIGTVEASDGELAVLRQVLHPATVAELPRVLAKLDRGSMWVVATPDPETRKARSPQAAAIAALEAEGFTVRDRAGFPPSLLV